MKYIFVVHSSITYFSALSVIEKERLRNNDCILLFTRPVKIEIDYRLKHYEVFHWNDYFSPITFKKILKLGKNVSLIDYEIENIICNSNYECFIPQVASLFNQVLITNRKCIGYNFIEEGIANYKEYLYNQPSIELSLIWKIVKFIFDKASSRLSLYPSFLGRYNKSSKIPSYYMFSEVCWLEEERLKLLDISKFKLNDKKHLFPEKTCFLVLSPLVEMKICSENLFEKILIDILAFLQKEGINEIQVKSHPNQSNQIINLVNEVFRPFIRLNWIYEDVAFEQILIENENFTIVGIDSSLLLYSKLFSGNRNVNCYAFMNRLEFNDLKYVNKNNFMVVKSIFLNNRINIL